MLGVLQISSLKPYKLIYHKLQKLKKKKYYEFYYKNLQTDITINVIDATSRK